MLCVSRNSLESRRALRLPQLHHPAASSTDCVHHGGAGNSEKAQGSVSKPAVKDLQRSPQQLPCPCEPWLHLNVSRQV